MTNKTLSETTQELWAFLRVVGESGALPPLEDVDVKRNRLSKGWEVKAYTGPQFDDRDAAEACAVVHTYAALEDAVVEISHPYRSESQPSGFQVSVKTQVTLGGIAVEVLALLDADEYANAVAETLLVEAAA